MNRSLRMLGLTAALAAFLALPLMAGAAHHEEGEKAPANPCAENPCAENPCGEEKPANPCGEEKPANPCGDE